MNASAQAERAVRIDSAPATGPRDKPLGAILLDAGLIRLDDVAAILALAREKQLRFGEAAVALGLVKGSDLAEALAFQFDYPVLQPGSSAISREVVAAYGDPQPVIEEIRQLRNQILLRWLTAEDAANRVVAIMSPERGEGRTFVAANLAVTFAQMGQRTLLVDADMRRGRVHALFGLSNKRGLSALLADRQAPKTLHRIEGLGGLCVIPSGAEPPNPEDLLSRGTLSELLEAFSRTYDVIVVDTPAAAGNAGSQIIAARAKGVVLVARHDRSDVAKLAALAHDVRTAGATVVGAVLSHA